LLELRNLSALIREIFDKEVGRAYNKVFMKNPNQNGYPDLLALTPEGRKYIEKATTNGSIKTDKNLWSPYPFGGIEVKATCGNTPPASKVAKPKIGESRINVGLQSAEWKAHHQLTRNLLGIFWDFVDGLPTVLATFYRNDL